MNVEYLRTSRKSYMMIKNADYAFENYELQMILHNDIPSLLEFQVIVGDGSAEYWYNVTGMQSLEKQLSIVPVREKQLRFLLQNIIELKREMEEYLLDDENICFSPSMIYYDRFADRIRFCYIPGFVQQEANRGIRELFEEILQHLDHSDIIAVRMGYDMYERSMQSEFIVEDCIECLTNHMTGEEERQKQAADSGTEYPDPEWEEDFVKNHISWLDQLKLRGGYGVLGNQEIAAYQYSSVVSIGLNYPNGTGGLLQGAFPKSFSNPDIKWEETAMTNVGIDFMALRSRLSLTADWYLKDTKDILLNVPIPISTGGSNDPVRNAGKKKGQRFFH